jgi:hypothetical protein
VPRYYVIPKRVTEAYESGAFVAPVDVAKGMEDDNALTKDDDEGEDRVVMGVLDHTLVKDPSLEDPSMEVRLLGQLHACEHRLCMHWKCVLAGCSSDSQMAQPHEQAEHHTQPVTNAWIPLDLDSRLQL